VPLNLTIIFCLAVGLPLAWLASEFQSRRWLSILLGVLALSMGLFLAGAFSALERFNYNAWYGAASADLIDATIAEIEGGRTKDLLPVLRKLRDDFDPTYENRAHYDELVGRFVKQIEAAPSPDE